MRAQNFSRRSPVRRPRLAELERSHVLAAAHGRSRQVSMRIVPRGPVQLPALPVSSVPVPELLAQSHEPIWTLPELPSGGVGGFR